VSVSSRPGYQPSSLQRTSANGLHYVTWAKNALGKWDLLWLHAAEAHRVATQQVRIDHHSRCFDEAYTLHGLMSLWLQVLACKNMDFACVQEKTTTYDLSFKATVGTASTFVCFDNVRTGCVATRDSSLIPFAFRTNR
jgi:hypothetical protein